MNALLYLLSEIKSQIPSEIINLAFTIDEIPAMVNLTSLDEKIMRKCIKARVLVDANIVRGIETIVPLNGIVPTYTQDYYTVYQIPPETVMNKEIMSALSLTYAPSQSFAGLGSANVASGGGGMFPTTNSLMNMADRIGNSANSNSVLSNTHLELVAYNTIAVHANVRQLYQAAVRVVLENDNNLQNISPRSYKVLSYLAVLAVKAYIYNMLIVKLNSGYLAGGQELGVVKSIVEGYESAEELYRDQLNNRWRNVAIMNDQPAYNRFLRGMISPNL